MILYVIIYNIHLAGMTDYFYTAINAKRNKIEIIFLSRDRS